MGEIIIMVILLIPLYGLLIWTYNCPEESILFGKRWLYKEEPEISEAAIRYTKFASLVAIIGLPIILTIFILEIHILKFAIVLLPVVFVLGAIRIFIDDK